MVKKEELVRRKLKKKQKGRNGPRLAGEGILPTPEDVLLLYFNRVEKIYAY